jgi:hypothetical protein
MHRHPGFLRTLVAALIGTLAWPAMAQSRGELLYTTHCFACHTTQQHWRDNRVVSDWEGLKVQVRRWQDAALLGWTDSDILDVSRYLNRAFYRVEQTADPVTSQNTVGAGEVFASSRLASHRR